MDTGRLPAYKERWEVQKHNTGDPSLPPDEIVVVEQWTENGQIVTDAARIAELEASIAKETD